MAIAVRTLAGRHSQRATTESNTGSTVGSSAGAALASWAVPCCTARRSAAAWCMDAADVSADGSAPAAVSCACNGASAVGLSFPKPQAGSSTLPGRTTHERRESRASTSFAPRRDGAGRGGWFGEARGQNLRAVWPSKEKAAIERTPKVKLEWMRRERGVGPAAPRATRSGKKCSSVGWLRAACGARRR